jgi:PAS domain S-box-containing protein
MATAPPGNLASVGRSEADVRALVENVADGIAVLNSEGVFQYGNPSCQELLGYAPGELTGQRLDPLVHPDDFPIFAQMLAEVLAHPGQTYRAEIRVRHKDGSWRVIESGARLLPGGHVACSSHDVTERKQAVEALSLAETKYRQLVERVPAVVYTAWVGADSPWLYVSPQVESLLGFTPEEWIGDPALWMKQMHPDDRAAVLAKEAEYQRSPAPRTNLDEYRFITCDGRVVWIRDEGIIYWDEVHQRHLWHGVLTDITQQKRADRRLAAQHAVTRVLAEAETLDEATPRLLQVVCEALEWDMGSIWRADEPADVLRCIETWRSASATVEEFEALTRQFTFAPGIGLPGRVWATGAPAWIRDVVQDDNFPRGPMADRVGLHGALGFPIFSRAEVRGVIEFFSRSVEQPDEPLLEMFRAVGSQIGQFMERKRAEAALRESEARTRLILDAALDAVITIDAGGFITGWNPQAEVIFGWSRGQAIGQRLSETIIPLEHRAAHEQGLRHYLATGEGPVLNQRFEITALRRNGELFPVELAITPLETRPALTFSAFVRDITDRKQAEEALRRLNTELDERVTQRTAELTESNRRLQEEIAVRSRLAAIIEATSDAVGTSDITGNLHYLNSAARHMLGFGEDESLAGHQLVELFSPEAIGTIVDQAIPAAIRDGTTSLETLMQHRNGSDIPVWLVGVAHKAEDGTPVSLSGVARDITRRKQAEAELKQAKEAAEAATRAKSTFLASMSHEIRTPMNAVIGMTSLLLNTPLHPKQREYVETVRDAGESLLTIINDILDFSKIEAGRLEMENQPLDVRACVEGVLDLLAAQAAEKDLELAFSMDASVPSGIVGDVTRLRQILVNLITNAIKFTAQGEVVVSVTARPGQPAEGGTSPEARRPASTILHFAVRDTGLGIPPDRMGRLFQSFSQLNASTTREYGGTGLGLAISKRLAELMGGAMWVESDGVPGHGSMFHFTLPGEAVSVPVRAPREQAGPNFSGRRLLVVDDNPTNQRILVAQLEAWGPRVQQAADAGEALAVLRQNHPIDLVVLDGHLPDMDGLALAAAIRRLSPPVANVPLVLLTSAGKPELEPGEVRLAAVLTKPVKPSQLYGVLTDVFAGGAPPVTRGTPTPPAEIKSSLQSPPLRILLAEDVVVNQRFALAALEQLGYDADIATDGVEALDAVRRQPYDVVLMDVHMPQMDGMEATRQIHSLWANADRRQRPYIIAMTANALEDDRELCLAAGMDDYLSKPVYLRDLALALERASGRMNGRPAAAPEAGSASPTAVPLPMEPLDPTVVADLVRRSNGAELIVLYLEEARAFLAAIAAAVPAGDMPSIQQAAHGLKGISGQVGAVRVASLAQAIERNARHGALDDDAQAIVAQLEEEFERARLALLAAPKQS